METLMDTAVLSRSWVRVSRSWESWVNGLLRTQTVADEEVLCATLRNGRAFKLYVNTSCSSPIMKGELLVDGKVISRLVRTAASLLTEWVFEAEDIFTVEISLASGDLDHRVKLLSETDQCFATLTAPDTFSRNFIVSVLKNAVKQMKDDGISSPECLLRRVCLEYGWTYYGKVIKWSSSNPDVATVDSEGNVTAVSPGTAKISVKYYTKTLSCIITVR